MSDTNFSSYNNKAKNLKVLPKMSMYNNNPFRQVMEKDSDFLPNCLSETNLENYDKMSQATKTFTEEDFSKCNKFICDVDLEPGSTCYSTKAMSKFYKTTVAYNQTTRDFNRSNLTIKNDSMIINKKFKKEVVSGQKMHQLAYNPISEISICTEKNNKSICSTKSKRKKTEKKNLNPYQSASDIKSI